MIGRGKLQYHVLVFEAFPMWLGKDLHLRTLRMVIEHALMENLVVVVLLLLMMMMMMQAWLDGCCLVMMMLLLVDDDPSPEVAL